MLEAEFRTVDLPVEDRFEAWYRMIRNSILPAIIQAKRVNDFPATTRLLDLGAVQVYTMNVPAVEVSRPPWLVRQSDPEHCHLILLQRGKYGFAQADQSVVLDVGDMMFYDSSHAFEGWTNNGVDPSGSRQIQVQFPRALLPDPTLVDNLIGVRLTTRNGMRSLLSSYLLELAKPSATYRGTDSGPLATATIDLIAALLAHEQDTLNSLPPETRQRALLARIHDFIRQHLADPDLSPGTIAAAHHISIRYLHKLFQAMDETVAGWIRQRRLERCHRDLADPRLRSRSIKAIAVRWGFADNAHFSRIFKTAYGISACEYRRLTRAAHETGHPDA